MASQFEKTQIFNASGQELITACEKALLRCNFKVKGFHAETGTLHGGVSWNFFSYGEKISITFGQGGEVKAHSECILPTQFIDWGKNKRNILRFFEALEEIIPRFELF